MFRLVAAGSGRQCKISGGRRAKRAGREAAPSPFCFLCFATINTLGTPVPRCCICAPPLAVPERCKLVNIASPEATAATYDNQQHSNKQRANTKALLRDTQKASKFFQDVVGQRRRTLVSATSNDEMYCRPRPAPFPAASLETPALSLSSRRFFRLASRGSPKSSYVGLSRIDGPIRDPWRIEADLSSSRFVRGHRWGDREGEGRGGGGLGRHEMHGVHEVTGEWRRGRSRGRLRV